MSKIGAHHGETRSRVERVSVNDPIGARHLTEAAARELKECNEQIAELDHQIAKLMHRRAGVVGRMQLIDPWPRGTHVVYIGEAVPRLHLQKGVVVGRDKKGWLLVDFKDGYGPVKISENNIKTIVDVPNAVSRLRAQKQEQGR